MNRSRGDSGSNGRNRKKAQNPQRNDEASEKGTKTCIFVHVYCMYGALLYALMSILKMKRRRRQRHSYNSYNSYITSARALTQRSLTYAKMKSIFLPLWLSRYAPGTHSAIKMNKIPSHSGLRWAARARALVAPRPLASARAVRHYYLLLTSVSARSVISHSM